MRKKRFEDDAALPRTEGGAADPVTEEAKAEPAAEVVPPPLPVKEVPEKPKEAEPPAPSPQPVAEAVATAVPLRVFLVCCGIKWDQMAGFKAHAKRLKLGPMSILEWRAAFADFQKRPVG